MSRMACPVALLLVFGTACGNTFCDAGGLALMLDNPPAELVDYRFLVEFGGRSLELECLADPEHIALCETSSGPWTLTASVPQPGRPASTTVDGVKIYSLGLGLRSGDDFSSFVPHGEVRVVVTSPNDPSFTAEHVFEADIQGTPDCEWAEEIWDLAQ